MAEKGLLRLVKKKIESAHLEFGAAKPWLAIFLVFFS